MTSHFKQDRKVVGLYSPNVKSVISSILHRRICLKYGIIQFRKQIWKTEVWGNGKLMLMLSSLPLVQQKYSTSILHVVWWQNDPIIFITLIPMSPAILLGLRLEWYGPENLKSWWYESALHQVEILCPTRFMIL